MNNGETNQVPLVQAESLIVPAPHSDSVQEPRNGTIARMDGATVLECITDAFIAVDGEWRFTYVNGEAERLLRRPREQLLGRRMWDEFPEVIGTEFHHEYLRATSEHRPVRFESFYAPERAWYEVRAFPGPDGIAIFFRDITAQVKASAEREELLAREHSARMDAEQQRAELESVAESRARLMRGFSHDVKNPLGAADGYAQLLEQGLLGPLSNAQTKSVRMIRRSIQASLDLIHDLLEVARTEAGDIELDLVQVDLAVLVREAVEDFQAQAATVGVALDVVTPPSLHMRTDPSRVRQILGNVIVNALRHAPGARIQVELAPQGRRAGWRRGDYVTIRVTDTGPGIPTNMQETIFEEFSRLHNTSRPGAGVGLAISRRIARKLGGDVLVESDGSNGSTFVIRLPRRGHGR